MRKEFSREPTAARRLHVALPRFPRPAVNESPMKRILRPVLSSGGRSTGKNLCTDHCLLRLVLLLCYCFKRMGTTQSPAALSPAPLHTTHTGPQQAYNILLTARDGNVQLFGNCTLIQESHLPLAMSIECRMASPDRASLTCTSRLSRNTTNIKW